MALRLIPQIEFFEELTSRGLTPTKFGENGVTLWNYKGGFYPLPLPEFTDEDGSRYCPFAIQLFFKHVMGSEAKIATASHGHKDYEVTDTNGLISVTAASADEEQPLN